MDHVITRREALLAVGGVATLRAAATAPQVEQSIVDRNDDAVQNLLRNQVTDPRSQWIGSVPDDYLLHNAGSAGGLIEALSASLAHPQSRFHGDKNLLERVQLAAAFLERSQSRERNIDLLSTNFNSPPDTGFVVHNVATAAAIGQLYGIGGCWLKTPLSRFSAPLRWEFTLHFIPGPSH